MSMNVETESKWWNGEYGFFGNHYMEGDDSKTSDINEKRKLLSERTIVEVDGIESTLNLQGDETILDIPCGYGRHSLLLSQRGYSVIGVDINSAQIEYARERANNEIYILENMLEMDFQDSFDVCINMQYSFGFFMDDESNIESLRKMFNAVKPNGKILIHNDINIRKVLSPNYIHREKRSLVSGNTLTIEEIYNRETKRLEGCWRIYKRNGQSVEKYYNQRLYTNEEFISMLKKVGFTDIKSFGDWYQSTYQSDCSDMVIVAKK